MPRHHLRTRLAIWLIFSLLCLSLSGQGLYEKKNVGKFTGKVGNRKPENILLT